MFIKRKYIKESKDDYDWDSIALTPEEKREAENDSIELSRYQDVNPDNFIGLTDDEKHFLLYANWIEDGDPRVTFDVKRIFAALYFELAYARGGKEPDSVEDVYYALSQKAAILNRYNTKGKIPSGDEITKDLRFIMTPPFERYTKIKNRNVSPNEYKEWLYLGEINNLAIEGDFTEEQIYKLLKNVVLYDVERFGKPNLQNSNKANIPPTLAKGGSVIAAVNDIEKIGFVNNQNTGSQYVFELN